MCATSRTWEKVPKDIQAEHKNKWKKENEVHKQNQEKDPYVLAYKVMLIHWATFSSFPLL